MNVRVLIRRILDGLPLTVEAFVDGRAAFDYMQAYGADLVITNLRMPGLDGNELLTAIRRDSQLASVPMLVVSGHADSISLDERPDGFVNKPSDASDIRNVVGGLLTSE